MATPFGPQLIGETEKTLGAILIEVLRGTGLSESHWVTLRVSNQLGDASRADLVAAVSDRAHFADAHQLVDELTIRGLIEAGRLTAEGSALVDAIQAAVGDRAAPIWRDLAADDVAVERFLAGDLSFRGITALVERAVERFGVAHEPGLAELEGLDAEVRAWARTADVGAPA